MKKRLIAACCSFAIGIPSAFAGNFIIKNIQINGLQGIASSTVYSYLPVKVGDSMNSEKSDQIIQSLYKTGFFDDVKIDEKGNTLIVNVMQRPIISEINISGNKAIATDKLKEAFKKIGFVNGSIYQESIIAQLKTSLTNEYYAMGKYQAKVDVAVTKQTRNRVIVTINISENHTARVHSIHIIGNNVFGEKQLKEQFKMSPTGLFSFMTHNDQYTQDKFAADLDALRSFYMDHGYLDFKVVSTNANVSPDNKHADITVSVYEGNQYKFVGYNFSGNYILPLADLNKLVILKTGSIFSRQDIIDATKSISYALGEKGYANAQVNPIPHLNKENSTVNITFDVSPGQKVYVRNIAFKGNTKTNDEVLRRALVQPEGALLSSGKTQESKRNILLLGYIRDVDISTNPVPGSQDQVDVNYNVTEQPSAEIRGGVGYSELDKFMITAGLNQKNWFGTGNALGLDVQLSKPVISADVSYYNPYFTKSGIGRSIDVYATRNNLEKENIADYAIDSYGATVGFNFPITAKDSVQAGVGIERNMLKQGAQTFQILSDFVKDHGTKFTQVLLNAGWSHQGFDRSIFPTNGLYESLGGTVSVPVSNSSLEYYKVGYGATYYNSIYRDFIGQARFHAGYGNGYGRYKNDLPFFKNYFAGGMGSQDGSGTVRGYEGNSLGPKNELGDSMGGKFEINGTLGLVFPTPLGKNVRTTVFVDGGNVYNSFSVKNIRYSAGLAVDWLSPIALLNFSIAEPLNAKPEDNKEIFQFNIGTSF